MWALILKYVGDLKMKDVVVIVSVAVIVCGFSIKSCQNSIYLKQTIETMTNNQVSAMKETAETARVVISTSKEMMEGWHDVQYQLDDLHTTYTARIRHLEQEMEERDEAIKAEFAATVKARADRLKEDYEKIIDDPDAAHDAFYNSLHLWDDIWGASPGG